MTIPDRFWILLARKKAHEATAAELEELQRMLGSNLFDGYSSEMIDSLWNARLHAVPDRQPKPAQWNRIADATGKKGIVVSMSGLQKYGWKVAVIALVFVSSVAAFLLYPGKKRPEFAREPLKNMNHVATRAGSKSKVELPDGTQVWLNGESRITYANGDFGKTNREVILTGEAFFDVVRNERVPFVIHTGSVNITVKGTAFNVKAYPKENTVETALVRGLVEITTTGDPDRKIVLKPNEKIIIPVRSQVQPITTDKEGAKTELYSISKLGTAGVEPPEIAWIKNQLVFDDEPLETIAPRLESWYHIDIHFTDETLKQRRFSGVIEKETIRETLEAMQLSNHFSYTIKGNELWLGTH